MTQPICSRQPASLTTLQELDNKGYICPRCTKQYTALEVDRVYDFVRNGLFCDICDTELVDNENSEKVKGSKDRMQRFNAQMKYIRDGLRNIEGVVMPAYVISASQNRVGAHGYTDLMWHVMFAKRWRLNVLWASWTKMV
jgi:hypothetical protein